MLTILWIVASGLWHFDPALAFDFPEGAFTLRPESFYALGSALLIAVYDYRGCYNVCLACRLPAEGAGARRVAVRGKEN